VQYIMPMTGNELRKLREQVGWTQVEFAKRLDINQGTVARWERYGPPQYGIANKALETLVTRLRRQVKKNSRGATTRSPRDAGGGG
jgi:DNA-binding transcriptional regulator YiaG